MIASNAAGAASTGRTNTASADTQNQVKRPLQYGSQYSGYIVCIKQAKVLLSANSCRMHGMPVAQRWLSMASWLALYQSQSEQLALAYRCACCVRGYLILQLTLSLAHKPLAVQHRLMSYRQNNQRLVIGSIIWSANSLYNQTL